MRYKKCKVYAHIENETILVEEIFIDFPKKTCSFLKNVIFFDEPVFEKDVSYSSTRFEKKKHLSEFVSKIILPSSEKRISFEKFCKKNFEDWLFDGSFKINVSENLKENINFKIIIQKENNELSVIRKGKFCLEFHLKTENFNGNLKNCPKEKIGKSSEIAIDLLENSELFMQNFLNEYYENYLINEVKIIRNQMTGLFEKPKKEFLKKYESQISHEKIRLLGKLYDSIFFKKIDLDKIEEIHEELTDEEKEMWLEPESISPKKFTKLKASFDRKLFIKNYCRKIKEEKDSKEEKNKSKTDNFLSPKDIKKKLDKYVIGQEKAKKVLSVAAYSHIKRISGNLKFPKPNVFMVGPTGTGKTYLVKKLGEILNIPIIIFDASSLTASGYKGSDLDDIFNALVERYDGDVSSCEKAIIYLDEIDKISSSEITADINGSQAQQMLLTAIEGNKFNVNSDISSPREEYEFDTSNVMFIVGGAFTNLFEKNAGASIGFLRNRNVTENFMSEKLVKYGMVREFVGRFSSIVELERHTKETLKKILTCSEDSILKQYVNIFAEEGIKVEINCEALDEIVEIAQKKNTGARSLKAVLSEIFSDMMFFYFGEGEKTNKIVISREMVRDKVSNL